MSRKKFTSLSKEDYAGKGGIGSQLKMKSNQKKVLPVSSASMATAKTSGPPKLQVLERKTRAKPSKTEHSKGLLTVSAKIWPLKSSVGKLTENSITSSTSPTASKSTVSKGKEKSKGAVVAGRHLGSARKVPPAKVGSSIPPKSDSKKAKLPSSSVQSNTVPPPPPPPALKTKEESKLGAAAMVKAEKSIPKVSAPGKKSGAIAKATPTLKIKEGGKSSAAAIAPMVAAKKSLPKVEAAKMSTSSPAEKKEMKEEALNQLKPPKTAEKTSEPAAEASPPPQRAPKKEEEEKKEEKKKEEKVEGKKKIDSFSPPIFVASSLPMMAVAAAAAISLLTAGAFIAFRLLRRT
ncbi:hypothetical protein TYRP_019217 [Tyrophagus putrescentiae]|nr:hypothetical protein TYRP_019217 [Tyrophagus putrescentiae]